LKEVKTGRSGFQGWTNVAESSKEAYGSKRAILPKMMMNVKVESSLCLIKQ
jgi:hypothetical protein